MTPRDQKRPRSGTRRAVLILLLAGAVLCLVAARPILPALLHGGDYTGTVALNWGVSLPSSSGCAYEADSGASFHGDGTRYHILEYPESNALETALPWQEAPVETSPAAEMTQLLEELSVPETERPDMERCRWYTAADPDDARNRLYLLLSPDGTRLFILESFF